MLKGENGSIRAELCHTENLSTTNLTWAVPGLLQIQGLSKRFERFKFGIFYVLIVKIRYNFTHQ